MRDQGRLRIDLRLDLSDQKSQRVLQFNENRESRLEQVVGDFANTLDRKVKFQISGRGVSFPLQHLERLQVALLHLLRNSMDHGIDPAEDFLRAL
jgi:chemotaxis protein histidine kinase CheA